jgi:hypothetical protein
MFKFAPRRGAAAYIGTYFGLTNVVYAATTVAAGWAFDGLGARGALNVLAPISLDRFALFFLTSAALRAVGVCWLIGLPEPGARGLLRARGTGE